jgi:hypothetical protein
MARRADSPSGKKVPKAPDKFLPYSKYVERFVKDVLALQRLWLVPLALCAFWLAIENSYVTYNSIKEETLPLRSQLAKLKREQDMAKARETVARMNVDFPAGRAASGASALAGRPSREEQAGSRVQGQTGQGADGQPGAASDSPEPPQSDSRANGAQAAQRTRLEAESRRLKTTEKALEEKSARIEELTREAVTLTVAGTVMPSRLPYAPTLWLAALLAWLAFFETLKLRSHKNLAAAVAAYGSKRASFGLSEESSLWLAPVPDEIRLRLSGQTKPVIVSRSAMLGFLGWTESEENRFRLVGALVWAGVFLVVVRMIWIDAELSSAIAVGLHITGYWARYVNYVGAALFSALCIVYLIRICFARVGPDRREVLLPRREALLFFGGTVGLLALIWSKSIVPSLLSDAPPDEGSENDLRAIGGKPRFIAKDRKEKRLFGYRVYIRLGRVGDVLVKARDSKLTRGSAAFHGVGSGGLARFYSRPDRMSGLRRIWPRTFRNLPADLPPPEGAKIPLRLRTASLEAAALALIEQGNLGGACDVLLGACQVSMRATHPNLRLFDLLAGLSVRYPQAADYKGALEALISAARAEDSPSAALLYLLNSPRRWSNPRWNRRWSDPRPVAWGHPLDLVLDQSPSRSAPSPASPKMKARLVYFPLTIGPAGAS